MSKPTTTCMKRLQQEMKQLQKSPVQHCYIAPEEENILNWWCVFEGPPDSPFQGGEYLMSVTLPPNYPHCASGPAFRMFTPNGRFAVGGAKICTDFSDFHSTFVPTWTVGNMCAGLLSFMLQHDNAAGCIVTDEDTKRQLAKLSHQWNVEHPKYRLLFPERYEKAKEKVESEKKSSKNSSSSSKNSGAATAAAAAGGGGDGGEVALNNNNNALAQVDNSLWWVGGLGLLAAIAIVALLKAS